MEEDDIVAIKGVAKDVAVDLANVDLAQAKASELAAAAGAGGLKEIADTGVVQEVGGDMAGLFVAPVAGPSYCRVFFLLCVCGTIAWFIALISGSVSTWQEPVTEVTQECVDACLPDRGRTRSSDASRPHARGGHTCACTHATLCWLLCGSSRCPPPRGCQMCDVMQLSDSMECVLGGLRLATELKYPDIYLCLPAQYAPSCAHCPSPSVPHCSQSRSPTVCTV